MKKIKLTQGQAALVDDEDFEYLNQFKWYAAKGRNTFYAMRVGSISMHSVILIKNNSFKRNKVVDHKDRNGLNNQKINLRMVSVSENSRNSICHKDSASRYKGVAINNPCFKGKKWRASICVNGKVINLGEFKTQKMAAITYNVAAKKYFGEFARLNKHL